MVTRFQYTSLAPDSLIYRAEWPQALDPCSSHLQNITVIIIVIVYVVVSNYVLCVTTSGKLCVKNKWTLVQFCSSTFTKQEYLYYLLSKNFFKDHMINDQLCSVYSPLNALVCSTEWLLWQNHTDHIVTTLFNVLKSGKCVLLNFNFYFYVLLVILCLDIWVLIINLSVFTGNLLYIMHPWELV